MVVINPAKCWSVAFAREWWPYLSPLSILRWRDIVVRTDAGSVAQEEPVTLKFKAPVRADIYLRGATSDSYTMREIMVKQVYTDLRKWAPDCRTVIDLGANIGLASLYLAAMYPECRLLAVEPHRPNLDMLRLNLDCLIQSGRATVLQAAVWSKAARLAICIPNSGAYDSVAVREVTEPRLPWPNAAEQHEVAGMTLHEIIVRSGFGRVDVLKVDIEGAEAELFRGDLSWLERVRCMAIEFHGDAREQSNFDETVKRYGFEIVDENQHTLIARRS